MVHGSSEAAAAFCAKSACEKASSNSRTLGWGPSAEATCAKRRAAEGCARAEPDELLRRCVRSGCGRKGGKGGAGGKGKEGRKRKPEVRTTRH